MVPILHECHGVSRVTPSALARPCGGVSEFSVSSKRRGRVSVLLRVIATEGASGASVVRGQGVSGRVTPVPSHMGTDGPSSRRHAGEGQKSVTAVANSGRYGGAGGLHLDRTHGRCRQRFSPWVTSFCYPRSPKWSGKAGRGGSR